MVQNIADKFIGCTNITDNRRKCDDSSRTKLSNVRLNSLMWMPLYFT